LIKRLMKKKRESKILTKKKKLNDKLNYNKSLKKLNKQNKKRKSKEKITKTQITMMILTFEEDLLINQKRNVVKILVKTMNFLYGLKRLVNSLLNLRKQNFLITL